MNLVETIRNYLSGELTNRLSSQIGAGEGATRNALGAAIPAVLSALSWLTSSSAGAQKLASALSSFDAESASRFGNQLTGTQANSVMENGSEMLNSLLGGNTISGLADALSRYTGIGSTAARNLLAYLMPFILSAVAKRYTTRGGGPQGLADLFQEEREAIARSVPAGFSMNEVPGVPAPATITPSRTSSGVGEASPLRWFVPIGGLALVAFLLWYAFRPGGTGPSPEVSVPSIARMTTDVRDTLQTLTSSLKEVKDGETADAALAKLKEIQGRLDTMKAQLDRMPQADRGKVTDLFQSTASNVQEQIQRVMLTPGAAEKVRSVADTLASRLSELSGTEIRIPTSEATQLSNELNRTFASLTEVFRSVKDQASAEAALPKLKELAGKIEEAKGALTRLPETERTALQNIVRTSMEQLQQLATKVQALAGGVGEKVKPTVEEILGKLKTLAG